MKTDFCLVIQSGNFFLGLFPSQGGIFPSLPISRQVPWPLVLLGFWPLLIPSLFFSLTTHLKEDLRYHIQLLQLYCCCSRCLGWYLVTKSCLTLCDPLDCSPPGSSVCGDSSGKNTGVGCLLQGIFLTQGSNLGLPHCRRILYHLSHQGSPYLPSFNITFLMLLYLLETFADLLFW